MDRRRDAAGAAPDTEWLAVGAIDDGDDTCIAAEPPGGLRRDGGAVLDFAAPRASVREDIGLDMDDDFVTVRGKGRRIARFEQPLGHPRQCIGAAHGARGASQERPTWDVGGGFAGIASPLLVAGSRTPAPVAAPAGDAPCPDVPRGTSSGAKPSSSHPAAGCSAACAAIAASSALRMRAPISGGNRPCSTTVPSSSCQKVKPRFSCCASACAVSSARFARRYSRTNFSTCWAVPCSPMFSRSASFSEVAMRVSALALEYPSSPFASASDSSGSSVSARATRTFSRAVWLSMPQAQESQWAQDSAPCAAQTSRRSSSAMRTRSRYVAAWMWAARVETEAARASSSMAEKSLVRAS